MQSVVLSNDGSIGYIKAALKIIFSHIKNITQTCLC